MRVSGHFYSFFTNSKKKKKQYKTNFEQTPNFLTTMKHLTFSKLINHHNKSSMEHGKFFYVLLIAQLIINLSPTEKFFSAQLII